jgi:hypothetical protein
MFGCISAITRAFSDGTPPPEYAQVSWFYHACSFLSTGGGSEELGELDGKAKEMIKKIDLRWVMSWLMTALYRAGVHYLRIELPSKEVGENDRSLLSIADDIDASNYRTRIGLDTYCQS